MKKCLLIHGPNMNMLGVREPKIYGTTTLNEVNAVLNIYAKKKNLDLYYFQSNHEGSIIDCIQDAYGNYEGIIINAAAYAHYSHAIADALKAVGIPAVEVHMSDITKREEFRKTSVIAPACVARFYGKGADSYMEAIDFIAGYIANSSKPK